MKQRLIRTVIASAVAGSLLVGYGCGSDDNGSGSTSDLTPEQQIALINLVLGDEGSNTALASTVYPVMLNQAAFGFWDGVDAGDIDPFLGLFGPLTSAAAIADRVLAAHLGKQSPFADGTPTLQEQIVSLVQGAALQDEEIVYNAETGWWVIDFDYSAEIPEEGLTLSFDVALMDSVRFEDTEGAAQQIPGETTARFRRGGSGELQIGLTPQGKSSAHEGGTITVGIANSGIIDDLNTSLVDVGGNSDLQLIVDLGIPADPELEVPETDLQADITLTGETTDLLIPVGLKQNGFCPVSGEFEAGLDADITAETESGRASFQGGWDLTLSIDGDTQTADLSLQADGYTYEQTTEICPDE
ncbi:MAG TPA: hypothetical protein VGB22_02860 [candidate division Zixibacteria bacterium]|jgi:hypothetical protein